MVVQVRKVKICLDTLFCGPVAQLVEQLTFNQWVTGSNPVGLTIAFHENSIASAIFYPIKIQ